MFGGEYCDGEITIVYNDLFRWNVEKNGGEWKRIESINTPPPRCSHQMVYFKDKVYLFGGEYATLDQVGKRRMEKAFTAFYIYINKP